MLESKGYKRTIASVFAVLAVSARFVPVLAPFSDIFEAVAGAFGIVGISHAAIAKSRQ